MYEYGNARIGARRSRLLTDEGLARLAAAESTEAMLLMLERLEDWRPILRQLGPLVSPARSGIELAIERRRTAALATLPRLFPPPARSLIEALVMPLDLQRVLEVLRRRHAGVPAESIAATVSRGALLDDVAIGALARAPGAPAVARLLGTFGLVAPRAATRLARSWERGTDQATVERELELAFEAARRLRIAGLPDEPVVAAVLDAEAAEAAETVLELGQDGPEPAADLERRRRLARFDRLAARSRRDMLGPGVAIGYVAAVEAEAMRLRAALASVASGWTRERVGVWLLREAA